MRIKAYNQQEPESVLLALVNNDNGSVYVVVVNEKGQQVKGGVIARIDERGIDAYRSIKDHGWPKVEDGLYEELGGKR
jgi:hypothetical protein